MNPALPYGGTRRRFLSLATKTSAICIATSQVRPMLASTTHPVSANERIRVGAIGVGGRGSLLLEQLPESAQIVALADCNESRATAFRDKAKGDWPIYSDYRKILDRKDIDAVIVATGEFQRIKPCIEACAAGKDVYAEKPLSLYIQEGRALVSAARKTKRIVQVGTQQRSMEMNRIACELVRNGGLGKILEVRAIAYRGPSASPAQPFPANPGFLIVGIDRSDPNGLAIGSQFDLGLRSDLEQIQNGTIDDNCPAVPMFHQILDHRLPPARIDFNGRPM